MAKKAKDKVNYTMHPNDALKKMGISQSKIKKTSEEYKAINKWGLQVDLILKGSKGQIAYVRHDLDNETDKWKLIIESPLDLTVTEQRDWLACASKFFKPLFIKEFESAASEKDFENTQKLYKEYRIPNFIRKPYKEFKGIEYDPAKPATETPLIIRFRSYAESAPYASNTTRKQDLAARNTWILKRYKQLKKDNSLSKHSVRYETIAKELVNKIFGNLKVTRSLATYTIKNILYSMPQKISD